MKLEKDYPISVQQTELNVILGCLSSRFLPSRGLGTATVFLSEFKEPYIRNLNALSLACERRIFALISRVLEVVVSLAYRVRRVSIRQRNRAKGNHKTVNAMGYRTKGLIEKMERAKWPSRLLECIVSMNTADRKLPTILLQNVLVLERCQTRGLGPPCYEYG